MICLLALPAFTLYRKKVTPYFIAAISHTLIGDIGGGVQLFWPITYRWYGAGIGVASLTNICAEWTLFLTAFTILLKTRDAEALFHHHPSNLLLSIPIISVLLPTFFSVPRSIPMELIVPHLTLLTIFVSSILIDLGSSIRSTLN